MSEETKMTSRKPAKPARKNTSSRSGSGQRIPDERLRQGIEQVVESRARAERLLCQIWFFCKEYMRADPGQARQLPANPLPARQLRLSKQPAERARQPAVPVQEAQLPEGDGRSCAGGEDHPAGRTSRNRKEHDSAGIRG